MGRFLSMVALATVAVAAAVAPAAALPAVYTRVDTPAAPTAPVATDLDALASVRPVDKTVPKQMLMRALRPVWKAFKDGKLDKKIADFKAGKLDRCIPSKKEVIARVDKIFDKVKDVVPKVFKLLDEIKDGKHDRDLAAAKRGNLEDFLKWLCNKLSLDRA